MSYTFGVAHSQARTNKYTCTEDPVASQNFSTAQQYANNDTRKHATLLENNASFYDQVPVMKYVK